MKYCTSCNSEYEDNFRFCRIDGTTLVVKPVPVKVQGVDDTAQVTEDNDKEVTQQSTATQNVSSHSETLSQALIKYCPICNTEYAEKFRFCRVDGTALVEKPVGESIPGESRIEKTVTVESGGQSAKAVKSEKASESPISSVTAPGKEGNKGGSELQKDTGPVNNAATAENAPRRAADPKTVTQAGSSSPTRAERFELLAQDAIKNAFPNAFIRVGVQIRSLRRSAEVDLFVLMPKGLFLIECKNYSGKIRGSLNYDQKQSEFWTCQNATGEMVQITSSGKNPADQALTRFHALHDMAKEAWGEVNRPYIYPVLVFPDEADLSGITQMTVYSEKPSTADRVVATTLSKVVGYLANAESTVEQAGALRLIDFLGIPRISLSGSWLNTPIETEHEPEANGDAKTPGDSITEEVKSESMIPKPEDKIGETQGRNFRTETFPKPKHPTSKNRVVYLALGLLLLIAIGVIIKTFPNMFSSLQSPSPLPPTATVRVMAAKDISDLNVRAGPSDSDRVLGTVNLRRGESLNLLDARRDRYRVRLRINGKDHDGWVHKSFFVTQGELLERVTSQLVANGYGSVNAHLDSTGKVLLSGEVNNVADVERTTALAKRVDGVANVVAANLKVSSPPVDLGTATEIKESPPRRNNPPTITRAIENKATSPAERYRPPEPQNSGSGWIAHRIRVRLKDAGFVNIVVQQTGPQELTLTGSTSSQEDVEKIRDIASKETRSQALVVKWDFEIIR